MTTERMLFNENDTEKFGGAVARAICQPHSGALLIALSGELGAGKTTFAKGFAGALGVSEVIQSPTFVLAKYYQLPREWPTRLVHIDAYRLESAADLAAIRWEEISKDPHTIILLEWPEHVSPLTVPPQISITLALSPQGGRIAALTGLPEALKEGLSQE